MSGPEPQGTGSAPPLLSVVITTGDLDGARRALAGWRAQTVADRIELVLAAPSGSGVSAEAPELGGFAAVRMIELDRDRPLPHTRLAGAEAATAPIVALVENHAFPEPGWAEAVIGAHRGRCAAVGPAMANANPATAISWAVLLCDYGAFLERDDGGDSRDLPGHNSSYKRRALVAGDDVERQFEMNFLHEELRARGESLRLEPRARIAHLNVSRLRPWVRERIAAGRCYAGLRAHPWGPGRRIVYALGSPLIPLVRLRRLLPVWGRLRGAGELPRGTLAALVASLAISAVGELLGYALGLGDTERILNEIELHRERYVRSGDLQQLAP